MCGLSLCCIAVFSAREALLLHTHSLMTSRAVRGEPQSKDTRRNTKQVETTHAGDHVRID